MKTLILAATLASIAFTASTPVFAEVSSKPGLSAADLNPSDIEKRRKKRVKGGSGCDDPGDVIEHPECA